MSHAERDPDYTSRIRQSFAAQRFMATIGADLERVSPDEVVLTLPFRDDLVQQHGFLHAGVTSALADSACGYAALTMMEPGVAVLSVEFKLNLLRPAAGERFVALGRVLRAGRTLTVCTAEVRAERHGTVEVVAAMQATMMAVQGRPGLID
jgi:uncharacterized protein (TIGR00369 family)